METIAVYWEPKPKTYGFNEVKNLSLMNIEIKPEEMTRWGLGILKMADVDNGFHLALAKYSSYNKLRLYILLEKPWARRMVSFINEHIQPEGAKDLVLTSPVELIRFQGPHFGDRYGIADSAFKALDGQKIPILIAACSGATVYIVLPENKLREAGPVLAEAFKVP